ncbi:sensor histidine kinase [Lunatimonas lonarensis]|uniref:histidine kinase n=1 Tax=Lunatimonas lonarensis TaxID=1232681 RepID=R7ZRE6_9BACT|nr:HAMP domain-containing sensor histidine kinase [Lunatimonas lonarensis]EON76608.1 sensor histidine kinase [Lunatimonas lonarensis]
MSLRKKILVYFSLTVILLTGLTLFFIYTLFAEYREEEFQQRQLEKITTTLHFLSEIRRMDSDILASLEEVSIQKIYDEKLLIFNEERELIYESLDDTSIEQPEQILANLSSDSPWIETKDGLYDLVGVYFEFDENKYFGISKAYDAFGYSKLVFLRKVLWGAFFGIGLVVIVVSVYLSERISNPITQLAERMKLVRIQDKERAISVGESSYEIDILVNRYNELMDRLHEAFAFQKHAIHHISHELKTPIAVLVTNFEKIEGESNLAEIKKLVSSQKEGTKSLGEMVNVLLEISKAESGSSMADEPIRMDELIFDLADEFRNLYPDFHFSIRYGEVMDDEKLLTILGNSRLMRAAISNLMTNCIAFSENRQAEVVLTGNADRLNIHFTNKGKTLDEKDQKFLFQHFFRGSNSYGTKGFGLGLVLVQKIAALHRGEIIYVAKEPESNRFTLVFPVNL